MSDAATPLIGIVNRMEFSMGVDATYVHDIGNMKKNESQSVYLHPHFFDTVSSVTRTIVMRQWLH